jgi:hypothetical protein
MYDLWVAVPDGPLTDAGAGGSAEATFATRDRPVSLDRNVWTLEAAENQSITGTTPVAPWREVTVRIQSEDRNNPLVDRRRVKVRENGTFTAEFDLSSLPPGTNVSIDAGNDTAVGRIPAPPRFTVADPGAPETAAPGETVGVAATVTNAGDRAGETTVTVGTGDWTPANETVALGPGESTTVTLQFDVPETTPERTYDFAMETANGSLAFDLDVVAETPMPTTTATTATTATETETPNRRTPTPETATPGDETTEPPDGGLPGFTPVVVLVAVSVTVVALRRRS